MIDILADTTEAVTTAEETLEKNAADESKENLEEKKDNVEGLVLINYSF